MSYELERIFSDIEKVADKKKKQEQTVAGEGRAELEPVSPSEVEQFIQVVGGTAPTAASVGEARAPAKAERGAKQEAKQEVGKEENELAKYGLSKKFAERVTEAFKEGGLEAAMEEAMKYPEEIANMLKALRGFEEQPEEAPITAETMAQHLERLAQQIGASQHTQPQTRQPSQPQSSRQSGQQKQPIAAQPGKKEEATKTRAPSETGRPQQGIGREEAMKAMNELLQRLGAKPTTEQRKAATTSREKQRTLEEFLKPVPPRRKKGKPEERTLGRRFLAKAARELEKLEKRGPEEEVEKAARELIGAPPEMYNQLVMKTPQGAYVRIATVKIELPTEDILTMKQQFATGKRYTIPATPEEIEAAKKILSHYYGRGIKEIRRVSQIERALSDEKFVKTLSPEERQLLEELRRLMNAVSKIESFRTTVYRTVLQPPLFFKSPYMEDWLTLDLDEAIKTLENVENRIKAILNDEDVVYTYARRIALAAGKLNEFMTNPETREEYLRIARELLGERVRSKRVYIVPNYQPLPVALQVLEAAKRVAAARLEDIERELELIERGEKKAANKKQKMEEKEKFEKLVEKLDEIIEQLKKLEEVSEFVSTPTPA